MTSLRDVVTLAPGVRLTRVGLADPVRDNAIATNAAGHVLVSALPATVADAAGALASTFGVARDAAEADTRAFVSELNRRHLANIEVRGGRAASAARYARDALLLVPAGARPELRRRRRAIDTGSAVRAAATAARGALPAAVALGALAAAVIALAGAVAAHGVLAFPAAFGVALSVGVVVHEAAHAALLRGTAACLVTHGLGIAVLHAPLERRRALGCALAGPVVPALAGVGAALVGDATLNALAPVLGAHALGATVLGRDGRAACGL